eukprot:11570804-Ditylum_brightwellii.AAC.1
MRNLSVQKGSAQRMIESLPDSTNIAKERNTKDWTINKLQFNEVVCWAATMKSTLFMPAGTA